ncbi:crossover junction endodeoxyribonuclease RuvC [Citricoccus muralis]|uniref:Crossover junction endodeoxyribonuclease RuvC n=1 Tax=Citricoccus muralis TaxID=169134 RepID=A0ABY8H2U1_9MICC|nr:crossover junction endodeoxyribonuclease RuvC [Citricoccus muralis]WFP15444.1 crossover junction endodeoxyribonuclease RuvC [Citricoccus muralis]
MREPGSPLRVIAVDPGLTRCGLAVVDIAQNRSATLVDVKVVGSANTETIGNRLAVIDQAVESMLDQYAPHHMAVERMFAQNNTPTVIGTAQASGVVIAAAARRSVPVALHTPSEVKAAVTGNGNADKNQITSMVTRILRLAEPPRPADAADAIALAVAHAWRGGLYGRGLDTGKLTSRRTSSKFPTANKTGSLTPAQQAWLAAEKRGSR